METTMTSKTMTKWDYDTVKPQTIYGLMVKACIEYQMPQAYHGDLYHDVESLKTWIEDSDGDADFFYWQLRTCGTYIVLKNDATMKAYIKDHETTSHVFKVGFVKVNDYRFDVYLREISKEEII